MGRRRLLTLLASTLAAGMLAMPAAALEVLDSTTETVEESADTLVTTVENTTVEDSSTSDGDATASSDDDGPLPTDEGELLEPLAPVTDPVEDALAPVLDPADEALDPAEPVVEQVGDTVEDTLGLTDGDTPTDTDDNAGLPRPPISSGPAPAGDSTTAAPDTDVSPVSAPDLNPYWAAPQASRSLARGGTTSQQPQVATPEVQAPVTAPAAEQPIVAGPIADAAPAGWEAILKVFAAFLVAATATMWQRAYAKAQIRR
jgi:hypothetical protein